MGTVVSDCKQLPSIQLLIRFQHLRITQFQVLNCIVMLMVEIFQTVTPTPSCIMVIVIDI